MIHSLRVVVAGSLEDKVDSAPSLYDFAKVRLHVGEAAPTTFFVSRKLVRARDGEALSGVVWESELSKMVQLMSASLSAAFSQGAAVCHVSMASKMMILYVYTATRFTPIYKDTFTKKGEISRASFLIRSSLSCNFSHLFLFHRQRFR